VTGEGRVTEKATVLVVDDAAENLALLRGLLRDTYRIQVANSGARALAVAAASPPDLILLDIMMPDLDGYEVCRRLRADPALRDVPVIFVTGLSETLDKVRAFAAGGVDFVTKPFQAEEVHARVATHLGLRGMRQALERQNLELESNNARLRELESLREGLTRMIVHDLRQPLTGLIGYLDLVVPHVEDRPNAQRFVSRAQHNAARLLKMINDLLDVAKLEEGKYPLRREAASPRALAEEAVATVASLNPRCRLQVAADAAPAALDCDPDLVRRVITNLVTNALQFCRDDGLVRVTVEARDGGTGFAVSDEGPGIPAALWGRIFEKFGAPTIPGQRKRLSTGLGLAFCRLAVEAHGGRIGLNSEEGRGTTFHFDIPTG
jgi:two-component system sensor histidine kinase/response regulator